MKKPMIGITPLLDRARDSYWMLPGYMQGVEQAGGIPVMLPMTNDPAALKALVARFDGFLFAGGQDVSPALYGAERSALCGETCPERDAMEPALLREALAFDKPVLGICRGIQLMNTVLGGTLYQDLPTEHPSEIEHHEQPPYDKPAHAVQLVEHAPLHRLLSTSDITVNSYHHQAIKKLATGLRAMGFSPDGLVEAVYMPEKRFVWAVQWHPEFAFRADTHSLRVFEQFVLACSQS